MGPNMLLSYICIQERVVIDWCRGIFRLYLILPYFYIMYIVFPFQIVSDILILLGLVFKALNYPSKPVFFMNMAAFFA